MRAKSLRLGMVALTLVLLFLFATACGSLPTQSNSVPELESAPALATETPLPNEQEAEDEQILIIEEIIVALLLVAALVGIATRWLRLPYTVGLVLIGLVLAFFAPVEINLPPNLILALLVPPLVFEAAFHINYADLKQNLPTIVTLAIPGVILTMLLVGVVVMAGTDLSLPAALLFGAIVSATDPVSVVALFRTIGVPRRLQVLLEGESLFNDGTSIILFGLMLTITVTGQFNLWTNVLSFFWVTGGGLLVGLMLGALVSQLISRIDDYLIETTLTTILAYGSYLIAEGVGVSGVLAVVTAGLVNGNIGPRGMSPTTRIVVFNFWEYAGFLANSFVFLLIGLQIDLSAIFDHWPAILTAILAVLVARAVAVYTLTWPDREISLRWQHILFWGGLRGAISLALALSLPQALGNDGDLLKGMAFGVVLFTLLVQGFSMRTLINRMNLNTRDERQTEFERRRARAAAVQAGYAHLDGLRKKGLLSQHTWKTISPVLKEHNETLVQAVKDVMLASPEVEAKELEIARRESLRAQRSTLTGLVKDGVISDEIYTQLITEVDTALASEDSRWPEIFSRTRGQRPEINRLMTVVIQEQDLENALSSLIKHGLAITRLPSVGGFLGRRNVTLLIGLQAGQEASAVEALSRSCRRRIEYVASPLESTVLPIPPPMPISVGGATIFVFEIEGFEEL